MAEFLKIKNKLISNNEGIGLVEALIAITLAIMLVVSLLTLTNFNIRNSLLVTENQDAINSANILLENLRSLKDSNFTNFITVAADLCSSNICTIDFANNITRSTVNLDNQSPTSYFRVRKISDGELEINITTEWKVGNTIFSSPLSTVFTNWRSK